MAAERLEHVLLSDVHLSEVVSPPAPGWFEYKAAPAAQDDDLVAFLTSIERRRPEAFAATEVVFNGDTFDFDLVYSGPEGVKVPKGGLPPTLAASIYKMGRILDDHPRFVRGLSGFLARGNRVVFVMGNHDRELSFPEVREVLRARLAAAAPAGQGARVAGAIAFEPWFVLRPGVLFAEHGQQYDSTCSYRDVLRPLIPADQAHPPELEMPLGSVVGRHMLSRLGTFNPFNDESFILSFGQYMKHFFRHYWPRRPFFRAYGVATWLTLRELWRRRRRWLRAARDEDAAARYAAYAERQAVDDGFIALLERLGSPPIADRPRHLMHELWLDRFGFMFVALLLLGVGVALIETVAQGLLLVALVPALAFVLRSMGRGSLALQERSRWGLVAEQIAQRLSVPVVAFGHSHRPERRPLIGGGRYYNLGSWAPTIESDRGSTLWRARRFLIVRAPGRGRVYAVFGRWDPDRKDTTG